MTSLDENMNRVLNEIQDLTLKTTETLTEIWIKTFDTDTCKMKIEKLTEDMKHLYQEIIQDTKDRQDTVMRLRAIKDMQEEASNLRRLLNIDVILSPQKNVPLHTVQIRLNESLHELREQLKKRKDQIFELLLEQKNLCEELSEQPRQLLYNPLPTEDELADFRLYLDALRAKKKQ